MPKSVQAPEILILMCLCLALMPPKWWCRLWEPSILGVLWDSPAEEVWNVG